MIAKRMFTYARFGMNQTVERFSCLIWPKDRPGTLSLIPQLRFTLSIAFISNTPGATS